MKDVGCNAGGSLSCINGGKCLESGECECPLGFTGSSCHNCESDYKINKLIF